MRFEPLYTAAEMRAAEEAYPGTTLELMERAGTAVADAALREYPDARRFSVWCGRGANGGDGLVVARKLHDAGREVVVRLVGPVTKLKGDAAENLGRARELGVPFADDVSEADVVVDALFGTGFTGPARGDAAKAIETMNAAPAPVVAVDIPSGVDGATGRVEGPAVEAAVTVSFAAEKLGTALPPGALHAGRVEVVDIGIAVEDSQAWLTETHDVAEWLPRRAPDAHKRSAGAVALIAGSHAMPGAAVLAAAGALRTGAGYVTLGTTKLAKAAANHLLPEVLVDELTGEANLDREALERFGDVIERADAVAVGPGLGQGDPQLELMDALLVTVRKPLVCDADALNVLARDPHIVEQRGKRSTDENWDPVVLTPHPAELGRLMGCSTQDVVADRLGAAREAATRFRCVVVLKGYRSLVAHGAAESTVAVNPTGDANLATAGTGDVLTGAMAALRAAGLDAFSAAAAATFVHGLAGEIAGGRVAAGVTASDVADAIPDAWRAVAEAGAAGGGG